MSKPNVTTDRRASPRFPVVLAAEVTETATGTRLSARTSDLSRNGCYIDTLNPIPVGTAVRVRLFHETETFEAPAKVVYVSPRLGMGLTFSNDLAPDQLAILDRWLAQAAKQLS